MFPFFLSHVNDDGDDDGSEEKSRTIHISWFHKEYDIEWKSEGERERDILVSLENPLKLKFSYAANGNYVVYTQIIESESKARKKPCHLKQEQPR